MSDTEIEAMAGRTAYNPWRVSIENILTGDNYFRSSEWHDLLADLDRLYALETNADAIRAAERERAAKVCRVIADQYRERGGHAAERAENAIRALK